MTFSYVTAFVVSGTNLFAGTSGAGVFLSTNNGASWTVVNNSNSAYAVVASGTNLFASIGGTVFLSTDNGTSWTDVNTGLTESVLSLVVFGTNIFAGTSDGGVWRRPLSEMITSVEQLSTNLPTNFYLSQNFPNPFNPSTTIGYQLAQGSKVTLKVYNVLGKEILTLIDEYKPRGRYEKEFSAVKLPSGVYFYQLSAGSFVETKKMLLIK